jgi:hypothetical protein
MPSPRFDEARYAASRSKQLARLGGSSGGGRQSIYRRMMGFQRRRLALWLVRGPPRLSGSAAAADTIPFKSRSMTAPSLDGRAVPAARVGASTFEILMQIRMD